MLELTKDDMWVNAPMRGYYRLRIRYTPYWAVDDPSSACVVRGPRWMSKLWVERPGPVHVRFDVSLSAAARAVGGTDGSSCAVFPPLVAC